jgi:hypothetical protein
VDAHFRLFVSLSCVLLSSFDNPSCGVFSDACVLVGGHDVGMAAIFPIKSPAVIRRKPACNIPL